MTQLPSSRISTSLTILAVAASLFGAARFASAQTNGAFKDLSTKLKTNDKVRVIDSQGRQIEGRVSELTSDSLTIAASDKDPITLKPSTVTPTVFKDANTRQITRMDSRADGAAIGFAAGFVPGIFVGMFACGESDCAGMLYAALFGAGGAFAGMAIDGAFNKTVYRGSQASQTKKTLAIAPVFGAGRRGLLATFRF